MGLLDFEGEGADWTHSNALVYTPDGNLLLSMRAQSWILKIDYENGAGTGDILWKLGEGGDFALSGGDPTEWFYAQHNPNIVHSNSTGTQMTLSIWDNGNTRLDASGMPCGSVVPCYSRPTIFQIDEVAKSANLVWQDLPGYYSVWGGSVEALSSGNVEFDVCAVVGPPASRILEVTQASNPETVWQMDVTGENAYRGYRIPSLYPGIEWK